MQKSSDVMCDLKTVKKPIFNRKKTSPFWTYFDIINEDNTTACCKICEQVISYKTSSNLKKHLVRMHPDVNVLQENINHGIVANTSKQEPEIIESGVLSLKEVSQGEPESQKSECSISRSEKLSIEQIENMDTSGDECVLKIQKKPSLNRKKSPIWNYFNIFDECNAIALCKLCKTQMSYKTSITNLKEHLNRKHRINIRPVYKFGYRPSEIRSGIQESINQSTDKLSTMQIENNETSSVELSVMQSNELSLNRRKSFIWKYFSIVNASDTIALCKLCDTEKSYRTITNLKLHLKRKHHIISPRRRAFYFPNEISSVSPPSENFESLSTASSSICTGEHKSETSESTDSIFVEPCIEQIENNEASSDRCDREILNKSPLVNRKRTSPMWTYFNIIDESNAIALCKLCNKEMSYRTTVSNLNKHLKLQHSINFGTQQNLSNEIRMEHESTTSSDKCVGKIVNKSSLLNRRRTRTSPIWNYFNKVDESKAVALCKLCKKEMSYRTTVSNLIKHLRRQHRLIIGVQQNFRNENRTGTQEFVTSGYNKLITASDECVKKIGNKSSLLNRRRTSPIWNYFHKVDEVNAVALCKLCKKEMSYRATVSNLNKHLRRQHRLIIGSQHNFRNEIRMKHESTTSSDKCVREIVNKSALLNRRKTSPIWNYFHKVDEINAVALCKLCKKEMSYRATVSNLNKHLRRQHRLIIGAQHKFRNEIRTGKYEFVTAGSNKLVTTSNFKLVRVL